MTCVNKNPKFPPKNPNVEENSIKNEKVEKTFEDTMQLKCSGTRTKISNFL